MKDIPIIFDFLKVQDAALQQLSAILVRFLDFKEEMRFLVPDASTQEMPQTNAAAQAVLETRLRLCAEVIESLETRLRTLTREKTLQQKLGQMLSDIQMHLNPDEPPRILASLYDATNTAVAYARENIQPQQQQNELLTRFENQLNTELGLLTERVNIQNLVERSRDALNALIRAEIEALTDDIQRQIQNAQLASDQIFNTVTEKLREDFRYYDLIKTVHAYLEVARDPDAEIQRVNHFRDALEDWKEEYETWGALLEDDAIYQELLTDNRVVEDIDPEDQHRFRCLFGQNGTSLQARLGLLEPTTQQAFDAAYEEYTAASERWLGDIHFLNGDQRAIVEHGCKWIDRIQEVWQGAE